MSRTATGPITGPMFVVPMQRAARARHREPISGHEAAAEHREDWTVKCVARRCNGTCQKWRAELGS